MNTLLHLLKAVFEKKQNTGIVLDPRNVLEKEKDYLHEETVGSSVVDPGVFNNPKVTVSPYYYENQEYTQSCVPHGLTLAALIELDSERLSKMFIYRQRPNYPAEGMWPQGGAQLIHDQGSCFFDTLPTPFSEREANALAITQAQKDEAKQFSGLKYFTLTDPSDIEAIANVAQKGKGVAITIFATISEWSKEYPTVDGPLTYAIAAVHHEVCVLPKSSFIENGIEYVTVQDSAWFGGKKLRHLSAAFIRARCTTAIYWVKPVITPKEKPIHTFTKPMKNGDVNEDVKWLQKVLNFEGLIEDDCITGNFYGRTLAAVKALQVKYRAEILTPIGLVQPTGYVGASTLAWLNRNYAQVT